MRLIDESSEWGIVSAIFAGRSSHARIRSTQVLSTAHFTEPFYRNVFRECQRDIAEYGPDGFSAMRVYQKILDPINDREQRDKLFHRFVDLVDVLFCWGDYLASLKQLEKLLHDSLIARGVVWLGEELQKVGDADEDPIDMMNRLIRKFESRTKLLDCDTPSFEKDYFATIDEEESAKSKPFHTGLLCFDQSECLYRGCNAVVAAKPGRGKSAIVLQMAGSAALRGLRVAYFGAEMPRADITSRVIQAAVGMTKDETRKPSEDATQFVTSVNGYMFSFDNRVKRSVADINATCMQLKASDGLDIVIVDHIGLLPSSVRGSRYEQVSQLSNDLRVMAGTLEVALVTVAQVNRGGDGKPGLQNLRDSGRIEEDATSVMFLHCEDDQVSLANSSTDVYFAKNRNGPNLAYDGIEFKKPWQQFVFVPKSDFGEYGEAF